MKNRIEPEWLFEMTKKKKAGGVKSPELKVGDIITLRVVRYSGPRAFIVDINNRTYCLVGEERKKFERDLMDFGTDYRDLTWGVRILRKIDEPWKGDL